MFAVGYVRLSRDDENKKSNSIENQKLIINQYAQKHNIQINKWYGDDNISGYISERPGFKQMMQDLENTVDTVLIKDLSRLGRKNSLVLTVLDDMAEKGKRLIAIDNNYDSFVDDDSILGITTWYNDHYVKDISKKIRSSLSAKQKEGSLCIHTPFGYEKRDGKIEVVKEEAKVVRNIFKKYIQGNGYRRIAKQLTENNIPTPSMMMKLRDMEKDKASKRIVSQIWSDNMVRDILKNDFYIGTLRLRKRQRRTIHGKDNRVPNDEQIVFRKNHEEIISEHEYNLVADQMKKRVKNHYHGSVEKNSLFDACLVCKKCGSKLTKITRSRGTKATSYYICSMYNRKGTRFCSKSHLIEEEFLSEVVINYLRLCRNALAELILEYDISQYKKQIHSLEMEIEIIDNKISKIDEKLRIITSQRVESMINNPENKEIYEKIYSQLEKAQLIERENFMIQREDIIKANLETKEVQQKLESALDVIDRVIQSEKLLQSDVTYLIDSIVVDEYGSPEIQLKYSLSDLVSYDFESELNREENSIIAHVMKLIYEDERGFTSAKYLSMRLTELGFEISKKKVLPYINLMMEEGLIEKTESPVKPYRIVISPSDIKDRIKGLKLSDKYELSSFHCKPLKNGI